MWDGGAISTPYRGYGISGSALPVSVDGSASEWYARGDVTLLVSDTVLHHITQVGDPLLVDADGAFAKLTGLFLAELTVDYLLPPPVYYLAPMNMAWAVDILRRAAERFRTENVNSPKLYEALDYLEEALGQKKWLVKKFRYALRVGGRDDREKAQLQKQLIEATRGIQEACGERIVNRINELAFYYRENKLKIDRLRGLLDVVRRPVRKLDA